MENQLSIAFLLCLFFINVQAQQATNNKEEADPTVIIVKKSKGQSNVFLQYTSAFGEIRTIL